MAGELVERLRAHDINLAPEWKDEADKSMWLDTVDALIGEAADRIEALERENATLRAEKDEARKSAFEQAASYHDDLASQHAACEYESSHHDLMVKLHQQFAAAIRNMGGEG